jgi:hypothetical protein
MEAIRVICNGPGATFVAVKDTLYVLQVMECTV